MKKIFTPQNYMTGLAVGILGLAVYTLTVLTGSWLTLLGLVGTFIALSVMGYFLNELFEHIDNYRNNKNKESRDNKL